MREALQVPLHPTMAAVGSTARMVHFMVPPSTSPPNTTQDHIRVLFHTGGRCVSPARCSTVMDALHRRDWGTSIPEDGALHVACIDGVPAACARVLPLVGDHLYGLLDVAVLDGAASPAFIETLQLGR